MSNSLLVEVEKPLRGLFNKLARTFACQLQALQAYRSTGQPHVTVTHLNVASHQAQVNVVSSPGGIEKSEDQPPCT